MKKHIIALAVISFIVSAAISYLAVEGLYRHDLKASMLELKGYGDSLIDWQAPEIKSAFSRSDDIGILYGINKLSKFKNVSESFILDSNLTVVIHNDSANWNKKYSQPVFENAAALKTNSVTPLNDNSGFLYSIPLDSGNTLFAMISSRGILESLNAWKIKLYIFAFVLSLIFCLLIYYCAKLLFLAPFNKIKKSLSMKDKIKKNMYSELIDMVMVDVNNLSSDLSAASDNSLLIKQLLAYILQNYISVQADVFALLDSNAKIVYCFDKAGLLFKDKNINTHIFNAVNNAVIIKNISDVLAKLEKVSFESDNIKIEINPVKNNDGILTGIIISGQEIR